MSATTENENENENENSDAVNLLLAALRDKEERGEQFGEFCSYNVCDGCGDLVLHAYQRDDDLPDVVLLGVIERGRVSLKDFGRCRDCTMRYGRAEDKQVPLPDLMAAPAASEIFVEPEEEKEEETVATRRVVTPEELHAVRELLFQGGLR